MKLIFLLMLLLALTGAVARGDDAAHFTRVEVPRNEERLTDLARLTEWRGSYEFDQKGRYALWIAEYDKGGTVTDYLLASSHLGDVMGGKKLTGIISVAWHLDFHNLIASPDHRGYAGAVHLPEFSPWDGWFFKDSLPETRKPSGKNAKFGKEFQLYPVMGICGESARVHIPYDGTGDVKKFLAACDRVNVDSVVIYLFFAMGSERPPMDLTDGRPPQTP